MLSFVLDINLIIPKWMLSLVLDLNLIITKEKMNAQSIWSINLDRYYN